jgi:hypothetical protein
MQNTLSQKIVLLTPPAALVNNGAVTVASVDTLGYDFVDLIVILGATDIALTTMKVTQSDDDSSYGDLANSLYGAGSAPALPTATDDNHMFAWHLRKAGKKRYFKPSIVVGNGSTGAFVTVVAILSRAAEMPNTATKRGLTAEVTL